MTNERKAKYKPIDTYKFFRALFRYYKKKSCTTIIAKAKTSKQTMCSLIVTAKHVTSGTRHK